MSPDNVLLFAPQCCDAVGYLETGLRCATDGDCYDALRPLGVAYWFSLPYRLGISPEWLIAFHALLLVLSAILAARVMHAWWLRAYRTDGSHAGLTWFAFLFSSLLAHAVWFYPLLRLSLSDMPASLMALIGIWLLCLSKGRHRPALQCLAGLCLGIACSLRVFFLYPLLGMMVLWLILGLIQAVTTVGKEGRPPVLRNAVMAALSALIPVSVQFYATFQHTGVLSYLDARWTAHWSVRHLDDVASGYDTVSIAPYRWYQSPCQDTPKSLLLSVAEHDPKALACLVMGRLYFYLGSYSGKVFHYGDHDNLLPRPALADPLPYSSTWKHEGFQVKPIEGYESAFRQPLLDFLLHCEKLSVPDQACINSALSEAALILDLSVPGEKNEKDRTDSKNSYKKGYVEAKLPLPLNKSVTFSAVAMAQSPVRVSLSMIDGNHQVVASQTGLVDKVPGFLSVTAVPDASAAYRLRVSVESAGTGERPLVMLWGMRAEQGGAPAALEKTSLTTEEIRYWSPWLLAVNGCFLVATLIAVWRMRAALCPAEWAALFFTVLSAGLSVVIVPEQRFFVVPIVVLWVLATLAVVGFSRAVLYRQREHA